MASTTASKRASSARTAAAHGDTTDVADEHQPDAQDTADPIPADATPGATVVGTAVTGTTNPPEGSAMAAAQQMKANLTDRVLADSSDEISRGEAAELLGLTERQVDRYRTAGILTALEPTEDEVRARESNPNARVRVRFHRAQVAALRAALRRAATERIPTQELTQFLRRFTVVDGVPIPEGTTEDGEPIAPALADAYGEGDSSGSGDESDEQGEDSTKE